MKNSITTLLLACGYFIIAQVGIGTNQPHPSASLELSASNKGMLFPDYNILNLEDSTTPVMNPAEGSIIYNSLNTNYSKGHYAWIEGAWRKMFVKEDINQFLVIMVAGLDENNQKVYINKNAATNNPVTNFTIVTNESDGSLAGDGETISLPPGKYKVSISVDVIVENQPNWVEDFSGLSYVSLNTYLKNNAGTLLSEAVYNSQLCRFFGGYIWDHYLDLSSPTDFKIFLDAGPESNSKIWIRPRSSFNVVIYELKES